MYFAYGHNTDTKEFKKRIPSATYVGVATLPDYKLCFHHVAGIEKAKGHQVTGVVWTFPKENVADLDWYEGLGKEYGKKKYEVYTDDGKAFRVFAYEHRLKPDKPPTAQYVGWLRKGYQEHGLPLRQINDALRSTSRGKTIRKKASRRKSYSLRG